MKKKFSKRLIAIILTLCMCVSLVPISMISPSAAINSASFGTWNTNQFYTRAFSTAGSILESLGEATGNATIAEITTFINNTFCGGSNTDEQLKELQNTCDEILSTVTDMEKLLNDMNSESKEGKIKESAEKYSEAWNKQVMDVMKSGNGKETLYNVYDAYLQYLSYASGIKTPKEGKTVEDYEQAYVSELESYYSNLSNDYYNNSMLLKQNEYYKYKMYTSNTVDTGISTIISSMLKNMDPSKDSLGCDGNKGHRFIDLAAQYAYYAYPYSSDQAKFVDMSAEYQINVVTTLVMIYQDFLARRAEYYSEINEYYNKGVYFKENNVNPDMLNEEDKKVYDRIKEIEQSCDTYVEKKLLEKEVNHIKDNYSTVDKCNSSFSEYYDADNSTKDYVGIIDEFQTTMGNFLNSEIYLSDVKASTTFDKYVREDSTTVYYDEPKESFTLVNENYKEKCNYSYKKTPALGGPEWNSKIDSTVEFTDKYMSFYKNASVTVENGKLVFTPFYVLNSNNIDSCYNLLKTFDLKEENTHGTCHGWMYYDTHYLSCDYKNLNEGVYTDGVNKYVPMSDIDQFKSLINETYYTANGCTPYSYFSSLIGFETTDNPVYLLLGGNTVLERDKNDTEYAEFPVFDMTTNRSYNTEWNSEMMSLYNLQDDRKDDENKSNSMYTVILVPQDEEIRSKVDVELVGEGSVEVTDYKTTDEKNNTVIIDTYDETNGTALSGEKVSVNIKAPENYYISNITVQYHEDPINTTKITDEKVISTGMDCNEFTLEYPVPYSNVSITVEIKEMPESLKVENGNYVVSSFEDLCQMSKMVSSCNSEYIKGSYVLTNDIIIPEGVKWTNPIGTEEKPFCGTFDGQGHTISNLELDSHSTTKDMGLFGVVVGGTIKNLNLEMGTFSVYEKHTNVGSVCGQIKNGTISNCNVTGCFCAYTDNFGGLVGTANNSTLKNCTTELLMVIDADESFGEICGQNINSVIEDCTHNNETNLC